MKVFGAFFLTLGRPVSFLQFFVGNPFKVGTVRFREYPMVEEREAESVRYYAAGERGEKETRTVLVLGKRGSDKRMQISRMVSYVVGVKYEDKVRFVVPESPGVTSYTFYWREGYRVDYNLVLVDAPEDVDNMDKTFRNLFPKLTLHLIVLVISALDKTEDGSCLQMFAKDVKNSIVLMFTNAELDISHPLSLAKAAKIPFEKYSHFLKEDSETNWDFNASKLRNFFAFLKTREKMDLTNSLSVLEMLERYRLLMGEGDRRVYRYLNGYAPLDQDLLDATKEERVLFQQGELYGIQSFPLSPLQQLLIPIEEYIKESQQVHKVAMLKYLIRHL